MKPDSLIENIRTRAIPLALLAIGSMPLAAQSPPPVAVDGAPPEERFAESPESVAPFARIRYVEPSLTLMREAGFADEAVLNAPVYPGDRVVTDGVQRGEIQLPDGSLVRFDHSTSAAFYAIGDPASAGDNTVVGLERGTIQAEILRIREGDNVRFDTPSASIYALEPSALRIDVHATGEVIVSVQRGRVEVSGSSASVVVRTGELTRSRTGRDPEPPIGVNLLVSDSFGLWTRERGNAYQLRLPPGEEYAELPDEVRPYYGELSRNGTWIETDEWGWVWRPEATQDDEWTPYASGYWEPGPSGPVWISDEPWGWPVYRYGRWEWYRSAGWVWLPGAVFSTAHVYWYYGPSYVGWVPLGYWNTPVYVGFGFGFGFGHAYFNYHPWIFTGYSHFYYHGHHYVHPHHGHYDGVYRGHASAVRRELARDEGVASRVPPDGRSPREGRPGARGSELNRDATARARNRARSTAELRSEVRDAAGENAGRRSSASSRTTRENFRQRERSFVDARRTAAAGRDSTSGSSAAASSRAARNRYVGGSRGADRSSAAAAERRSNVDPARARVGRGSSDGSSRASRATGRYEGGTPRRYTRETEPPRSSSGERSVRSFMERLGRSRASTSREGDRARDEGRSPSYVPRSRSGAGGRGGSRADVSPPSRSNRSPSASSDRSSSNPRYSSPPSRSRGSSSRPSASRPSSGRSSSRPPASRPSTSRSGSSRASSPPRSRSGSSSKGSSSRGSSAGRSRSGGGGRKR